MQFNIKYYNVNKSLMSKLGIWPTQNILMKIIPPTITTAFIFSVAFLEKIINYFIASLKLFLSAIHIYTSAILLLMQFIRLIEIWEKLTEDCESFIILILALGANIKYYLLILNNKNVEQLLSVMDYHWRVFTHSLEVQIMHEYATLGRKITITYSVIIYVLTIMYMMVPLTPQLLDLVVPLNKSRPYLYLFDVDYNFDKEMYYYPVLLHSWVTIILAVSTLVINDTSYMMFGQHVCSLFAAIGYRLENLTLMMSLRKSSCHIKDAEVDCKRESTNDRIYRELALLVRKHQLSLEYVDLIESLFHLYSFSMIFLHFIVMSLLGMQIMFLMNDGSQTDKSLRYVAIVIGGCLHLFVLSYPGQKITDHSADIFHKAYNMMWYRTSRKTKQLLSILLYRSFVPCILTAGKMYVLSYQNYCSVMQGTLSYFTALSSFN